ncbi:HPr family phosphocarrier protein [Bosea vaviloviae]|uniref:Phosphocarrier protein HPr n=1 Tax=Bosea vaviloviae TaxID=1526658 RepID=A0A1D7U281_9HYPH|nr:HPr family phosphocarrier protein [Bosea vaviloviae]AOO81473.1 phosphocarrier protein HPr [Bosea vaviloviae]
MNDASTEGSERMIGMQEVTASALLTNKVGLHARPSVKLTQLAKRFASRIEVATSAAGPWTDAKSPVKIMRVKASQGEVLHFKASGADATAAITALVDIVTRKFDEE